MGARGSLGAVVLVSCMACATSRSGPTLVGSADDPVASDDVPVELVERLRAELRDDAEVAASLRDARVAFVGAERVRRKTREGEDDPRDLVRLVHYRYDDDAAIHTTFDARAPSIVERRVIPHLPTMLGPSELEEATRLALSDARVLEHLGDYADRVEVEALVVRASNESDPYFGRRIVRTLFRVGRDYIGTMRVFVDLTARTVTVEENER